MHCERRTTPGAHELLTHHTLAQEAEALAWVAVSLHSSPSTRGLPRSALLTQPSCSPPEGLPRCCQAGDGASSGAACKGERSATERQAQEGAGYRGQAGQRPDFQGLVQSQASWFRDCISDQAIQLDKPLWEILLSRLHQFCHLFFSACLAEGKCTVVNLSPVSFPTLFGCHLPLTTSFSICIQ